MSEIVDFFNNRIFLTVVAAWLVTQLLKFVIHIIIEREVSFERLFGDGGMPSGHSATVMTLALLVGYSYGYSSVLFAICAVIAAVVMHDASGVRRETGKQAIFIKELADMMNELTALFGEKNKDIRTEKLKVFVGHTPLQVFCGALVGIAVSIAYVFIFDVEYCSVLTII